MPVYVVQLPRSSGGQTRVSGRDCVLVNAASTADARACAKNVILGSGYTATMWDAADVTELSAPADMEGFRLRVAILAEDIDVTVTAGAGDDIDDMGTDMASALNALDEIAGASYDTGTNLLTVANEGDALSANTMLVQVLPPTTDTVYGDPSIPIPSFVTAVTSPGGTNEIQTLTIADAVYGTYTITYSGQTTSALAYNANAATVQAALIALSNLATGDVVVTGTSVVTGLTLTFGGTLAGTDVAEVTATLTGLVQTAVATDTAGVAAVDEIQSFDLGAAAASTFTITYDGQTTAAIAYNADAATVQAALETLSNVGVGDIVCSGGALPATPVVLTFASTLAGTDVPEITISAASLSGGTVTIATDTPGVAAVDEVQRFDITGASEGNFTISVGAAGPTANIAWNASAAAVQSALEAVGAIGVGNVACSGSDLPNGPITVTFQATLGGTDVQQMTIDAGTLVGQTVTINTITPGVVAVDEVQSFDLGAAVASTFTITYSGQTTAAIAYNAVAATVQSALEALSNIEVGDVTCSGGALPGTPVVLTFAAALAGADLAEITIDDANLVGGTVTIATDTPGVAPVDEVQSVIVRGYPSGTFTITYSGQTTAAIARNASAATIQTALRLLSNLTPAKVTCAGGPLGTAPVTITFVDALAGTNVDQVTLTTTGLVAPEETIATATIGGALTATLVASTAPQAYNDPGISL